MNDNGFCEYPGKQHQSTENRFTMILYRDVEHGILNEINICQKCYEDHILKYYPNGNNAAWIRRERGEK